MYSATATRRVHVGFTYMMVLLATISWEVGNTSMVKGADTDGYASTDVPAMFVFGDSLVDPGNGVYLQATSKSKPRVAFFEPNHLPYGRDFPSHRPTGRYSNGLTLADIIATSLGLPYPSPYLVNRDDILKGTNFAVAGAVIDNRTGIFPVPRLNFYDQVGLFAEVRNRFVSTLGESSTSTLISKALIFIWIGANDFYTNYNSNPLGKSTAQKKYNPYEFNKLVISSYRSLLETLYDLGARKFGIVSIPPLGCVPVARFLFFNKNNGTCLSFLNEEAQNFNWELLSMSKELQAAYPDGHFTFLNTYDTAFDILTNPIPHGFSEGVKPCCATGPLGGVPVCSPKISSICEDASKYVFWDFGHPTEAIDMIAAKKFMTGSPPDVQPYNIQELSKL